MNFHLQKIRLCLFFAVAGAQSSKIENFIRKIKTLYFFGRWLEYGKVGSTSTSRLEAHSSFYRLFIKGKLDVYLLWPFGKKALLIRNMHWYFMVIIFLFNQYPFSVLITKDRKSFSCYKERFKNPFKRCAVFVCLNIASCFHFGCFEL